MKIRHPEKRLASLWGYIDRQHNCLIASFLPAKGTILDVGCGYGSLVNYLSLLGYQAEGIDIDPGSIQLARQMFPSVRIMECAAETFSETASNHYDAIVLKDCLHHLMHEGDVHSTFAAFRRLLKTGGKLVILDPNPTLILRISRYLIRHVDPEASLPSAFRLLKDMNFTIRDVTYYEVLGLPLSGGYVGLQFVPNIPMLNRMVAGINHWLSTLMNRLSAGRWLCWRYVISATKG